MRLIDFLRVSEDTLRLNYLDKGLITRQTHPTLPLHIYNYTHKTMIDRAWDEVTMWCRGLITTINGDGKEFVISTPFRKFFNLDEHEISSTESLQSGFRTFGNRLQLIEKLDGSLGVGWRYVGQDGRAYYGVATRDSFTSPQAEWATKVFNDHQKKFGYRFPLNWTPMFEIIYPENRIVVEYPYSGLVGLGLLSPQGNDMSLNDCRHYFRQMGFRTARIFSRMTLEEAKTHNQKNFEGFIATIYSLEADDVAFRAKIKCPDYCRLHTQALHRMAEEVAHGVDRTICRH